VCDHARLGRPVILPTAQRLRDHEETLQRCCDRLSLAFDEFSSLRSLSSDGDTDHQRTLSLDWLTRQKTELIRCIDSIKGVLEDAVACSSLSITSTIISTTSSTVTNSSDSVKGTSAPAAPAHSGVNSKAGLDVRNATDSIAKKTTSRVS